MTSCRWLALALCLLGCHASSLAPTAAPRPPAAPRAAEAVYEQRVPGPRLSYRFRTSRFSNLFYTIDCLSGSMRCTRSAFEELATRQLGGLDAEDRAQLDAWRALRRRYQGRIEKGPTSESPFPLPRAHAQVERRVRLAGYLANDLDEYAARATMLLDVRDVERARAILARFEPRFDRYWQREAAPALRATAMRFAEAARAPALSGVVDQVAAFYAPDVPVPLELTFELVLRPAGARSSAEQLAHVSLIEVEPDEKPSDKLDVVLHEVFHYFLSQVPEPELAAQMDRFAGDPDPLAYIAQGTLDEGLATAFGNGLVLRTLDPAQLARRLQRPQGMYADDTISAMASSAIDPLARVLEQGSLHVTSPELEQLWVGLAHAAFPNGAPPQAYLRPFAGVYPPELEAGVDSLYDIMQVGHSSTDRTLDPAVTREMFSTRPRWTRVLFLRPADLPALDRFAHVLGPAGARDVRALARRSASFAYASTEPGRPTTFVFVAPDSKALTALVTRFAAVPTMHPGPIAAE